MKAVEFESVAQGGQIELPPDMAGEIPQGEQLRVVVMWEPSIQDGTWRSAADNSLKPPILLKKMYMNS